MPVHPSQWHLSDTLSGALCWILLNISRLPSVLHLLDDFLLIDSPSSPPTSLQTLKDLFLRVGVPLSREKTLGPSTKLEFLGINLDSDQMLASLPEDKLARIRQISRSHLSSSVLSKRDLLSLLGHLNFAMRIIPQGRSFISRLLDLANSVPHLLDQVSLVRSLLLVRTARPLERHLFFLRGRHLPRRRYAVLHRRGAFGGLRRFFPGQMVRCEMAPPFSSLRILGFL
ncbi:PREDICTED: uncharacterized protein LOC106910693 [Poecilia mexicana]|uniref:uncharacterized protein LOC106910693 n=1 Tax=Poecilia mexicana TaxID=48701 RepID=UPI00072DF6E4|nr:PREDICTED: uncharacterized protein LOC106910693 [Poecilia mexicana]